MSARAVETEEPRTSDSERENFAVTITDTCNTHQEWLAVVRYGLGSLLENQPLLIEIIVREAVREIERGHMPSSHVAADEARRIFQELGLRFEVQ
jgi:hypothetical protein